jgi:cobalt-zinc-cadmium efflux system outer membrane protein
MALGAALVAPVFATPGGDASPPAEAVTSSASTAPPPISLDRAEALTLAANPGLSAMEAFRRASDGTRIQAGARPNPELLFEAENFALDLPGGRAVELTLSVAQPIETAGKRSRRLREAEASREAARLDRDAAGLEMRAELRRRFVTAMGHQERIRVLQENLRIAEETLNAVRELVRAGEVSPIEELKVDADASMARTDLAKGKAELLVARRSLASLWGAAESEFGALEGALSIPTAVPAASDILPQIQASPSLARWKAEEERRAATLDLQKALARPDLTVAVGVRRFQLSEQNTLVASVGLPLPLFDSKKGTIAEAAALCDWASLQRQAEFNRLRADGLSAVTRLNGAVAEATRFQDEILPKFRQVYDSVEEGYRRGKFRLLELLDARRSLAVAVLRYNDALVAAGLATADLFLLTGGASDLGHGETR